jgi:hypothetical protein
MKSHTDVVKRVAAANPVPGRIGSDAASEALLERIMDTQPGTGDLGPCRVPRNGALRIAALAAVALIAVAVPTLALANHYGILGLSNPGEPVDRGSLNLRELGALETYGGNADGMRRLGERAGVAFYAGRSKDGGLCFATGSAAGSTPRLDHSIGCQANVRHAFPSPQQPILNLGSAFKTTPLPRQVTYVLRLGGFAADGVTSVGYVDTKGVTHTTPVVGNIYATDWFEEDVAVTAIVALDAEGRELYRDPLPHTP